MAENIARIASFEVDHDLIVEGIYVSRIDGDITTYDLRTRIPNNDSYMDSITMHSMEHMFATYVRNSDIGKSVIYFGPMGCRTGFYLLVRGLDNATVLAEVKKVLSLIASHEGEMFGATRKECGNYRELSVESAKREAENFLAVLNSREQTFEYPKN